MPKEIVQVEVEGQQLFVPETLCLKGSSVEIGYRDGRRVEYFYNRILSEKQLALPMGKL